METPNVKILVVDDEGAIRALLSAVIKGEGFKSIEAPSTNLDSREKMSNK